MKQMEIVSKMICTMFVCLCVGVSADPLPDGGPYTEDSGGRTWTFMVVNGEAQVGNDGFQRAISSSAKGTVVIPSVLGERNVTKIRSQAFRGCEKVTRFVVPEGVRKVLSGAFEECTALESISLPSTLRVIGTWAFAHNPNLTEIDFPASVTSIGKDALYCCGANKYIFRGNAPTGDGVPSGKNVYVSVYATGWEGRDVSYIENVDTISYTASKGVQFDRSNNEVQLSCSTPNSVIHYTLDGTAVTTDSPLYTAPLVFSETTTLNAKAYLNYKAESELLTVNFVRTWHDVADVVFCTTAGTFASVSQEITLSCETEGATIYYTIDGSEPSAQNGRLYKDPFNIYQTTTVKAIAVKDDWKDSAVASATFTKANAIGPAINLLEVLPDNDKDSPWTIVTDVTHDGVSAVKSGAIEDDESTTLTAVIYGAGELSFWWKASCEPAIEGEYYDYGTFYNGSTIVTNIAGVTEWQHVTLKVPDTAKHTFKWTYQKDGSGSTVPDCIWLDQVQWLPETTDYYADHTLTTEAPVKYKWLRSYGLAIEDDFEAAAKAKTGKLDGAGRLLTVEDDFVAGTDPTNLTSRFISAITMEGAIPKITWTPDLGEEREYKVWGKASLVGGDWVCPTNSTHRFFKVTVEMP